MDFNEVKHLIEEFFNGKFEVKKFLGEGSFAKVYLVNHNYLDALMAMKIVKEPLKVSTNKKDIFREVTMACQLRHENIISIYDAAEISDFEDGANHAYFLMEYVPGGDLEHFLNSFIENDRFISISRSLDFIRQILSGLKVLHSASPPIIHRDLKLNNVLLSFTASGDIVIKISDFGFAKEVTTSISDIDIAGTRPYMAPELFSKIVSTRSDIYAVGVIFYQLLTNRYPYDVEKYTNHELIDLKPWENDIKPPSYYNENVSEDLDKIVLKCLDFDAGSRYFDAGELLRDVEKAIDEYNSAHIVTEISIIDDYRDEYEEYIINDSIKQAFELAKCENRLHDAIEIMEHEVLSDYNVRKCYSEILRIWKSKNPDLKLISKAFTVNLKGKNYKIATNFLNEAIAYNPSLKNKYQHYIDLWEIFIDLESHGNLFKSVALLEDLMDTSPEIEKRYRNILPALKSYSVDEIVVEAVSLVKSNNLFEAANLMEFAVVSNSEIRKKYAYKMSLWKQNMKMHFNHTHESNKETIDYAIDLGTTDSVISYFNDGNPVIVKNHRTGDDFTPSAVLINDYGMEVGVRARDAIFEQDNNAVSEFKNNMGFSIPFRFENSSRVMYPEDLSAEVLKDLRVSVFKQDGISVEHAVICVPANSNPIKTRAINDAAKLAGFRSHSLIPEPVAVSLAYRLRKDNGIWMIYDLGGGTFNVTLIGDNNGEIEMIASDGLENLGGNAFDWKIVNELFRPKIASDMNINDFRRENPKYVKTFARLKNAAEEIKKDLTKSTDSSICVDELFENYTFEYHLTREKLKETVMPLIDYTFKMSRNLLNKHSLNDSDMDKIILVGGSCLSPVVAECIEDEFDIETDSSINPLTVVSQGAAIYAGSLVKPSVEVKKEEFSVILYRKNNSLLGKVFSIDERFSFLGFEIGFKSRDNLVKVPLSIDGEFSVELDDNNFNINIYHNDAEINLDIKSPGSARGDTIRIPYLESSFAVDGNAVSLDSLMNRYIRLLKEVEFLKDHSYRIDDDLMKYIDRLIEISKRNPIAFNLTQIYLNHLDYIVNNFKEDLEFSILLENVLRKIRIVKENDLFDIDDTQHISKNGNLAELKEFYSSLIEKYVFLKKNEVIRECFYNLKLEGVYSNNENLAFELLDKGQSALYVKDYDELLDIVNMLYELDERWVN